ncbi:hypothetical protein [Pedobacter sp. MW01-1-1]|uniref:hypothetical protein n=1 Tax=Pedobacter sp. MW01-1-1 TaxID=3383027 RepID=UPI003FF13CF0
MKTILVPTDFSLESTQIIEAIVAQQGDEKVNIIFLHAFKLSDSITDMLMLSRRSRDYETVPDEFYERLKQSKSAHAQTINNMGIEYFYGSTVAAFKNFIEAFEVDQIAYLQDYPFKPLNKYSIDPKLLTERSGCPILVFNQDQIPASENLLESKIEEPQHKLQPV